jgi:Fe-S cluster assembly iron-binding protein IscA
MNYVKPDEQAKYKTDEVIEQHGVKVFVDPKAIFYVVGTSVVKLDERRSIQFISRFRADSLHPFCL